MQVKFSNFYRQVPPPTHFQLHRADELSCLFLSGELFLRMLKALILPLVVPSLITAVGSLDLSLSGKVRQIQSAIIFTGLTVSTIFP